MTTRDLMMMPLFTAMALLSACAAPVTPPAPAADTTAATAPAAPATAAPTTAAPTKSAEIPAAPAAPTTKISKEQALEIAIKEGMAKDALSALLNPTQLEATYKVKSSNPAWRFLKSGKVVVVDAETGAVLLKK